MGEAIADGQTGRLIKPRDIEGTWRALADLADDVALADRLGTAARRRRSRLRSQVETGSVRAALRRGAHCVEAYMIRRLIFPDPLVWQSGLEWGIEAFAMLVDEGHDLRCCLRAEGPMFEAIAFAASISACSTGVRSRTMHPNCAQQRMSSSTAE
jgi:hypothetical protein